MSDTSPFCRAFNITVAVDGSTAWVYRLSEKALTLISTPTTR